MAIDWDDVFAYETFKTVKVRDRRLGILYYSLSLAIAIYILYTIISQQLYLEKEIVSGGSVRATLQTPNISASSPPPYCTRDGSCVYWPAELVTSPSHEEAATFITSRVTITPNSTPLRRECNPLYPSTPNCVFNFSDTNKTTYFIGGIEDMTLLLSHSVRGRLVQTSAVNTDLKGSLLYNNGTLKQYLPVSLNAPQSRPANVPGDVISVKEFLDAASIDLDTNSNNTNSESLRFAGVVMIVFIEYSNRVSMPNEFKYTYSPAVIPGSESKVVDIVWDGTINNYVQLDRHGVRIRFIQTGQIGTFNFQALLRNLVAAFALLKVAQIVVEFMMVHLLPQKDVYKDYKFSITPLFNSIRNGFGNNKSQSNQGLSNQKSQSDPETIHVQE